MLRLKYEHRRGRRRDNSTYNLSRYRPDVAFIKQANARGAWKTMTVVHCEDIERSKDVVSFPTIFTLEGRYKMNNSTIIIPPVLCLSV